MGAFLDKPKTEKSNESGEGGDLRYASASMQGWRVEMEDAHAAAIGLSPPFERWSFFAVFDGHAGSKVAKHSASRLLDSILQELSQSKRTEEPEEVKKSIRNGFLSLDQAMRQLPELHGDNERSGTTAVAALICPTHLYIANLGDSRIVLSRGGTVHLATEDHKPYNPKERDRILTAGGSVMIQRVNGSLAVSRALGDYEYKCVSGLGPCEQLVSPEPDVHAVQRDAEADEFLILACDGIFDVMNNQELCDFVRSRLRLTPDLREVCNQVLDTCLSKGSRDNMSLVLVTFPGAPRVTQRALDEDRQLKTELEKRISEIVSVCDDAEELDVEYVLRRLINQDIPGVPPGAGLHAMRTTVEAILQNVKGDLGGASRRVTTT